MGCFFNDSTFVDSSFILVDYNVLVPCNGIDNGVAVIDSCGVCHQSYIYNFQIII